MIKIIIPFLLFCLWSVPASAQVKNIQNWSFGTIHFPDGTSNDYYMYYNSFQDWLHFKNEDGELRYFNATDIVSFDYQGNKYYSLPFISGSLTFFKVEYEGNKTALLSKPSSLDLMQFLATRYDKIYTLCNDGYLNGRSELCEINYSSGNPYSSEHILRRDLTPVTLNSCLFAIGEEGLKLFQIEVEKRIFIGLWTVNQKRNITTLESIFGQENRKELRKFAKKNRLKENKIEDLVTLFRYYDSLN